jgi:hypothetical protein
MEPANEERVSDVLQRDQSVKDGIRTVWEGSGSSSETDNWWKVYEVWQDGQFVSKHHYWLAAWWASKRSLRRSR